MVEVRREGAQKIEVVLLAVPDVVASANREFWVGHVLGLPKAKPTQFPCSAAQYPGLSAAFRGQCHFELCAADIFVCSRI